MDVGEQIQEKNYGGLQWIFFGSRAIPRGFKN
jgi:hypothetical protein